MSVLCQQASRLSEQHNLTPTEQKETEVKAKKERNNGSEREERGTIGSSKTEGWKKETKAGVRDDI